MAFATGLRNKLVDAPPKAETEAPKTGATKLKIRQGCFGGHVFLAPLPDLSAY